MRRAELFALALGVLAAPACAAAQSCVLVVLEAPAGSVEPERLRERIAQIGDVCVVAEGAHAGVVRVEVRGGRGARVRVELPGRERAERTVSLPEDPHERAETLAILAGNLVRDESAELLRLLVPPEPLEPAVVEPIAGPEAVAAASVPPSSAEPVATSAPPSSVEPVATSAPPETAPIEPVLPVGAAPSDDPIALSPLAAEPSSDRSDGPPSLPFLRLGLSGEITVLPQGTGFEVDGFAGAEIAWTAPEWIAAGVRGLGAGGTRTGGVHVDATPFVELVGTLGIVSGYAQLGAHLQLRVEASTSFEVAPLVTAGARLRLADVVSIGLETTLRLVATRRFASLAHELPAGALPWTLGVSLLFHVS